MSEVLNIRSVATPEFSPFCNGIMEHHKRGEADNDKMRQDAMTNQLSSEAMFIFGVMAKSFLMSTNGYSPYQVVFGG